MRFWSLATLQSAVMTVVITFIMWMTLTPNTNNMEWGVGSGCLFLLLTPIFHRMGKPEEL